MNHEDGLEFFYIYFEYIIISKNQHIIHTGFKMQIVINELVYAKRTPKYLNYV